MESFQQNFIDFIIQENALKFGEFTLKSGRISPYFFNIGHLYTGTALTKLGQFYAEALKHHRCQFDVIFGPAYKGVPLAVATAMQLAQNHHNNVPYSFNRKEAKNHGEGGLVVGAPLANQSVWIIDDVITAGHAKEEAISFIKQHQASVAGIIIALDRQEKAENSQYSSVKLLSEKHNIPIISIITLDDLITYLQNNPQYEATTNRLLQYKQEFGAFA